MSSRLEQISGLERRLHIVVPMNEVQAAFTSAFQDIQRNVTLKGFRKGKAPMHNIIRIFSDRVSTDVVDSLVKKFYPNALQEHDLSPVNWPTIEYDFIEKDKDFSFTAEFEVRPQIQIGEVGSFVVPREKMEWSDSVLDKAIEATQARHARIEAVEDETRACAMGDIAVIDYAGTLKDTGVAFEGGTSKGHYLLLGSGQFIPGFEDGVVGMKKGEERNIELTFPTEYHSADLAGKTVNFHVVLQEIKSMVKPDFDDELVKKLNLGVDTAEEWKAEYKKQWEHEQSSRIEDEFHARLLDALLQKHPIEVPKSMIEEQKAEFIIDYQERLKENRFTDQMIKDAVEERDAEFVETAELSLKRAFLLAAIRQENNISLTDDDISAEFASMAERMNNPNFTAEMFENMYKGDKERMQRFEYALLQRKTLKFIESKVEVTEVSAEELQKAEASKNN